MKPKECNWVTTNDKSYKWIGDGFHVFFHHRIYAIIRTTYVVLLKKYYKIPCFFFFEHHHHPRTIDECCGYLTCALVISGDTYVLV